MKNKILTLSFMLLSVALIAQISNSEKQALVDLFETTNGTHWINPWNLDEPVETWKGITIENDEVVGVSLLFNNIQGTLPSSLANLQSLRVLELSFNKISGDLPESLGYLSQLEVLAFNGNNLMGTIPASFGNLHSLKQLHLSSNLLSGTIPNELGQLQNLEVFNVFDNDLVGIIPSEIFYMRNIKELMVAENNLITTERFSSTLLANSGIITLLNNPSIIPSANTIMAIESSDDEN